MQWNAQLYLFMYLKFVLWIVVTLSVIPVLFWGFFNCRTSSNCVNMQIQSAASPPLRLTAYDPTPSIRGPEGALKCRPLWPHSCCFLCCCPLRLLFTLNMYVGRVLVSADPSWKTWDCFCLQTSPQHTVMYMSVLYGILLLHGSRVSLQTFVFVFYMQRSLCTVASVWWKDFWLSADRIPGVFMSEQRRSGSSKELLCWL